MTMKTPTDSSQISQAWVEFMLTQYEGKSEPGTVVTVDYFTFANATKPGESFNAELVKLDVNATLKGGGGRPPEARARAYHLIVKFFSQDPFNKEMVRKVGYHVKEFQMYSEVAGKLNAFQASLSNNAFPIHIPEFIYGKCSRKDFVLVIRNMKEKGYDVGSKERGLTVEQATLAVEQIARLHGVSYAYNARHDKGFLSEFPCYAFNRHISTLFKAVVRVSVDNALAFLRARDDCQEIADRLERGKARLPEKFEAMWDDQSRHALLCLTHGDFWCNNLLFLPAAEGEGGAAGPSAVSVIDWQISQWNSPVLDLHYLLATSTTAALRAAHLPALLRHYHATFTAVTLRLEAAAPRWSLDEFRAEFDKLSLVGLLMGICLVQGTLSKAGEGINRQQATTTTTTCGGFALIKRKAKALAAKVAIPVAFQPSCSAVTRLSVRSLLRPIRRELLEGGNATMNGRLLELVREAQQSGLLDALSL